MTENVQNLKGKIREVIEEIFLKSKISLKEIIIFGSWARGSVNLESDIDLLVIVADEISKEQKKELWRELHRGFHQLFPLTPFDVIIKTKADFENEKHTVNTISNEAYLDGIRI